MNLSKSVKILRVERLKLSQRAFADRVGVFYPLIANLETGKATNPTLKTLTRLADAGGLTVAQFLELPYETDAIKRD